MSSTARRCALLAALASRQRACRIPSLGRLWIAAERIPELVAVHSQAVLEPPLSAPPSRQRDWSREAAVIELLRGRLCIAGPVTAEALAAPLDIDRRDAEAALLALESEGVILRGRFTPAPAPSGGDALEWCDRALLARIHRYTLNRLRAEIEPVSAADFMRFLFKWQHVDPADRLSGVDGLREVLALLDGFELAGTAWERSVLPARVTGYDPTMLDMLCLAGEVGWARMSPRTSRGLGAGAAHAGDAGRALPPRAHGGVAVASRRGRRRRGGPDGQRPPHRDDAAAARRVVLQRHRRRVPASTSARRATGSARSSPAGSPRQTASRGCGRCSSAISTARRPAIDGPASPGGGR